MYLDYIRVFTMETVEEGESPVAPEVRHPVSSAQQNIQSPSSPSPSPATPAATVARQASIPCRRRGRLQRSERLQSDGSSSSSVASQHQNPSYSSLEALIRDSFGQIVWPIRITSWDLLNNAAVQREFMNPR